MAPFISFGPMPLANGFLRQEELSGEDRWELAAGFCEGCAMVQLTGQVPPERMFHGEYPFFTSSSARMSVHFQALAAGIADRLEGTGFVVEVGSNDGTLLRHLASRGMRHLGVDPSEGVAEIARGRGVETWTRFFDQAVASDIVAEHGRADVVVAANCFCHVPDLHSLGEAVRALLKPDGLLIFEDPYLGDILRQTAYDQIYDEHAFYFSLASVSSWLARHGLEVVGAHPQAVHGGSMRYVAAVQGTRAASASVGQLRRREADSGLLQPSTYQRFAERVRRSRDALLELLRAKRSEGRRVAGYGATSKSTTVLNYCGIGPDLLEFIADTTPLKQGRYSPGMHVPIRPPQAFGERYPDYALLFAWNHAAEIFAKERDFAAGGGRWIRYVPEVALV